jgi:thioredoxin 1
MHRSQSLRHGAAAVAALAMALLLGSCQRSASTGSVPGSKGPPAQTTRITFVELGSDSCIPCKAMQPILERIRQEYPQQVAVVFHDVWTPQGKPFASTFRIRVIPTQVFLDAGGREYFRHEGFLPYEEVLAALERGGLAR